jgi:hypothetical protein
MNGVYRWDGDGTTARQPWMTWSLFRGSSSFLFTTMMRCPSGDNAQDGPGLSLNWV